MLGKLFKRRKKEKEPKEHLKIVPVPALIAVLLNKENEKGSPLTEEEVIEIRDNTACIAMPISAIEKLEESRGYADIDPELVWEQWQIERVELVDNGNS